MKEGLARLTLDIPLETLKKLKIVSAIQRKSMKDIILPLLEKKLKDISDNGEYK